MDDFAARPAMQFAAAKNGSSSHAGPARILRLKYWQHSRQKIAAAYQTVDPFCRFLGSQTIKPTFREDASLLPTQYRSRTENYPSAGWRGCCELLPPLETKSGEKLKRFRFRRR